MYGHNTQSYRLGSVKARGDVIVTKVTVHNVGIPYLKYASVWT